MVIQPTMSSKAIIDVWNSTNEVFSKYGVPISAATLESTVETKVLYKLLLELNNFIGSSSTTCIEGG
ncbi:MAG: hypothetical protein Q8934_17980 [Bacillota bacterium]|nr:hypothetical protein [Bacillota bacterium]